jgi:hypothetical protein
VLCSLVLPVPAAAADSLLNMLYEDAVLAATTNMTTTDIEIIKQANTKRFTLIVAKHASGAHITVTLRRLAGGAQVFVAVSTDNPRDIALENRLVDAIRK